MTWFKVDDGLHSHPKWLAASPHARALWVSAGSWAAAHLTDGHVPRHALPLLGGRLKDATELVRLGLWESVGDGWAFHDWATFQPSAESVEADRAAARERQRRARDKSRESRRDKHRDSGRESPATDAVSHGPPDPTRPDLPSSSSGNSRGAQPPAGGKPPETTTSDEPTALPPVGEGLTPDQLWPAMAHRKLGLERTAGRGPTSRGQVGWLRTTAATYEAEHHQRAVTHLDDTITGTPADYLVWLLEPDLSDRDYTGFTLDPEPTPDPPTSGTDAASDALAEARARRNNTPGDAA